MGEGGGGILWLECLKSSLIQLDLMYMIMMMMMRAPMIQVPWYYCHHHLIYGQFIQLDNQGAWSYLDFDPCFSHLTDQIYYQSVALPPLAAPAQTWKPKTANMNTLAIIVAAASAQIHMGFKDIEYDIPVHQM